MHDLYETLTKKKKRKKGCPITISNLLAIFMVIICREPAIIFYEDFE